ncbi:MAG: hypothetical protein ABGZ35_27325 [Planctomycetaceae bacterium]
MSEAKKMATLTESQWEGLEQLLVETGKGTRHESFDSYRLSEGLHFLALLKNLPKGWSACTWSKGDIKAMLPVLGARWVVETGAAGDFAIVQTEGLVTMSDVAERLRLTTVSNFTLIAVSRLWKISDEFSAEKMLRRLESPMDIKVIEVISKYGAWRRLGDGKEYNIGDYLSDNGGKKSVPKDVLTVQMDGPIRKNDARAAQFRDGDQWCDKRFAGTIGISPQLLNKAIKKPKHGVQLSERRKAVDEPSKPYVFLRAELGELADAIPDAHKFDPERMSS